MVLNDLLDTDSLLEICSSSIAGGYSTLKNYDLLGFIYDFVFYGNLFSFLELDYSSSAIYDFLAYNLALISSICLANF